MFYITQDNKLLNYADTKYSEDCKFTDIITQRELDLYPNKVLVENDELVLNPDFEVQELEKAKQAKYDEANIKARYYLESGEALYPFVQNDVTYHIEATDGNIAKIGLKATSLLIVQDFETTFPWNTKEDININLNALEGKEIAEGLGNIQDIVWTIKFPLYIKKIENAETIEEVEAIVIDYAKEPEEI